MSLEYKILGQELVSYTTEEGTEDTTSYYVTYEEGVVDILCMFKRDDKSLQYSVDGGSTWTTGVYADNEEWSKYYQTPAYGDGRFVILPATNNPNSFGMYSEDGINWTKFDMPEEDGYSHVVYGNGVFAAVNGNGQIRTSLDGINWSDLLSTPYSGFGTNYTLFYSEIGQRFLLFPHGYSAFAYSEDLDLGVWSQEALPFAPYYGPQLYEGNGKVGFFSDYDGFYAWSLDGGISFTNSEPTATIGGDYNQHIAFGNNVFVKLHSSGHVSTSADGVNWLDFGVLLDSPGYNNWASLSFAGGKFVAFGSSGIAAVSLDGISWNSSQISSPFIGGFATVVGKTTRLVETLNIIGGQGTTQTEEFLPVTFYTVPEGKQTTVTSVFVANHNDTTTTYDFAVVPAGEELSLKHHLRWDMEIAAKDFENISTKITMSAGDKLVIFPSTVDTVSVTAFGVEK